MEKIVIRQKAGTEDKPMTGMNCEVFLNGKKLTSATAVSFSIDSQSIARVKLELIGNIEVEGNIANIEKEEVNNEPKES